MEARIADKNFDGIYILRALLFLENDMRKAAVYLQDKLFVEYWGSEVTKEIDIHNPKERIRYWLFKADQYAKAWKASSYLFLKEQETNFK